jgi:hypothetical protein
MEGGRSAWLKAVMAAKKPGMSLGDAMKAAKKTYKKGGAGSCGASQGGMLAMPPMGGRRRRSTRKGKGKMMGGTSAGFTGGPYTGSDLADGMSRFPSLPDATWKGPSELLGGRRRRSRRRGGAFAPSTDGKPAELPGAKSADAPETALGANGTFSLGGSEPVGFGGRRRRHTKKAGRRRRRGGGAQDAAAVYGAASSEASAAARQAAAARNGYM